MDIELLPAIIIACIAIVPGIAALVHQSRKDREQREQRERDWFNSCKADKLLYAPNSLYKHIPEEKRKCEYCHAVADENEKHCEKCGAPLTKLKKCGIIYIYGE